MVLRHRTQGPGFGAGAHRVAGGADPRVHRGLRAADAPRPRNAACPGKRRADPAWLGGPAAQALRPGPGAHRTGAAPGPTGAPGAAGPFGPADPFGPGPFGAGPFGA